MLGAVVLEDAAQVAQAREQQHVAEEDRGAHETLDHPEEDRGVAQLALDQARQPDGDQEEQPDREDHRQDDGRDPDAAGDLLRLLLGLAGGQLRVGRDPERAEADRERLAERDDAAQDRQAQQPVAAQRRADREVRDLDLPERGLLGLQAPVVELLGARLAHGDGPVGDAAHHHALEHRLPAERCVALRGQLAVAGAERRRIGCRG